MDYKEKYEMAVKAAMLAKQDTESAVTIGILEEIFPELRESEDERIRKGLIEACKQSLIVGGFHKDKVIAWLEKQGEQKPVEWSDEDEKMINDIIMCCEHHCYLDAGDITWLKLLKERYTWKPSDEQMDMLRIAVATSNSIVLYSLYNDLEKLKD